MSPKLSKDSKNINPEDLRNREPWDQLQGETYKQYSAFLIYRNMPPEERSLTAVWKIYNPNSSQPRSAALSKWADEFRWEERASAWDRHFVKLKDRATEKTFQKDLVEERGRRQEFLNAMSNIIAQYFVWVNSSEKESNKLRALTWATSTYLEQSRKEYGDDPMAEREREKDMQNNMENVRAKIAMAMAKMDDDMARTKTPATPEDPVSGSGKEWVQ